MTLLFLSRHSVDPHKLTICVFHFWEISLDYFHSRCLQRIFSVPSVLLSSTDLATVFLSFPAFRHFVLSSSFWMISSALLQFSAGAFHFDF